MMAVSKEKYDALRQRMEKLGILEDDLVEKFILGSGSGGQKVNKTSSCVYLCHVPSGIEIKCQQDRSREMNRFIARRELCDRFEGQILQVATRKQQEAEKVRRQKQRRSRRSQQKMLDDKKLHATKKALRSAPPCD